ncbi:MAG: hypothetical protein KDJ25_01950 [Rhodoblastus sp.]|nr:hypothetical protein [Rhodoblastus sp.]
MRRWLRSLADQLGRDDLFMRLACLISGAMLASIGGFILIKGFLEFRAIANPSWWWLLAPILPLAFLVWGLLLASRMFTPVNSRFARLAETTYPDQLFDEWPILILIACVLAPAVLLTLALRFLGVSGQRRDDVPTNLDRRERSAKGS